MDKSPLSEEEKKVSTSTSETVPNIDLDSIPGKSPLAEQNSRHSRESQESSDLQLDLVSLRICQVIVPVTLCSIYVVLLIRILEWNVFKTRPTILDRAWDRLGLTPTDDKFATTLVTNIVIVSAFVALIVAVTLIILLVFYMEWHQCLTYYFYLPSFIIMTILTPYYVKEVLLSLNWFGLDFITLILFTWNFALLGMIAIYNIYTTAPLYVQQLYLIHNSAILAVLIISCLPGWAPWILLGFLVIWDLFAVLAPFGPLNLIISMAEREGVIDMPGLIYTTDVAQTQPVQSRVVGNDDDTNEVNGIDRLNSAPHTIESDDIGPERDGGFEGAKTLDYQRRLDHEDVKKSVDTLTPRRRNIQEKGVNIGLGDFIFYSLLIGLCSKGRQTEDFYTTLASLDAILVGLVLTLVVLAITRRAVPALPISIALGLIFAALTMYFVSPFANRFASAQIFI